jgi:hypothetical protein
VDVHAGLQLYLEMVAPVVERFTQGFNACVLAYGQTGVCLMPLFSRQARATAQLMCLVVASGQQLE